MQHEREPVRRRQRLQHDQQGPAHRVGQLRLVLGVAGRVGTTADPCASSGSSRRVVRARSRSRADPGDHRRQPAAEVLDPPDVLVVQSVEPQPRLLDRVVGLVDRARHRYRPQVGAVLLEGFDLPVGVGHCHILASRRVIRVDVLHQRDVTFVRPRRSSHDHRPGLQSIVYPVRDLEAAKAVYAALLGQPHADQPYYVGFNVDGQEIGLNPHGHQQG